MAPLVLLLYALLGVVRVVLMLNHIWLGQLPFVIALDFGMCNIEIWPTVESDMVLFKRNFAGWDLGSQFPTLQLLLPLSGIEAALLFAPIDVRGSLLVGICVHLSVALSVGLRVNMWHIVLVVHAS